MHWIAPSEKDTDNAALEKRLWDAADQFRANSGLKSQEYSAPVLGLIFLRFAEVRFALQRAKLETPSPVAARHPLPVGEGRGEGAARPSRRGSRVDEPAAYHAEGILYLPSEARFDYLLNRPEAENIGAKVNAAMRDIEKHNPQLAGVLPKTYNLFTSTLLKELLKKVSEIPASLDYDAFGRIYEYFLGEFAMSEGQGGGEFYTPSSIVRLLTEVIEPYHGRILDPACGSGGMFVSSARFVAEHKSARPPSPASPLPMGEGRRGEGAQPSGEGSGQYRGGWGARASRLPCHASRGTHVAPNPFGGTPSRCNRDGRAPRKLPVSKTIVEALTPSEIEFFDYLADNYFANPPESAPARASKASCFRRRFCQALRMRRFILSAAVMLNCAAFSPAAEHVAHSFRRVTLTREFWSEGAGHGDFNRDGKLDVVSGPYWYEGPDFQKRHEFYPATQTYTNRTSGGAARVAPGWSPKVYSDNFFAFSHDFNADQWPDIFVIGFPGKEASWFENPRGQAGLWKRQVVFDTVDNESPHWVDLTGDGRPELVCNHNGFFGYAQPDSKKPGEKWAFHPISPKGKWAAFTHGLGVGDVNGDGRMDLIEKGGWWEQPASLDGDPVWKLRSFNFGAGGAQMHVYDVNGDGFNDVVTSLVAHGFGLAWFEQLRNGDGITFRRHLIMNQEPGGNRYGVSFSMLHAVALADIDGDGLNDIVTGKRFWLPGYRRETQPGSPAPLYWFKLARQGNAVDFIPQLIDPTAGLGVQLDVVDLDGDKRLDVIAANKQGTFVFRHEAKQVTPAEWQKTQPKLFSPQAP